MLVQDKKLFDYNPGLYGYLDQKVSLAFKPGEEDILAFGVGDNIKIFELSPQRELIQRDFFEHCKPQPGSRIMASVSSIAFSSDGNLLISGSGFGTIKLWLYSNKKLLKTLYVDISDQ